MRINKRAALLVTAVGVVSSYANVVRADAVTDWNDLATTVGASAQPNPLVQSRAYAMTQAAVHDALNAIDRRFEPYAYRAPVQRGASPEAAVAAAAAGVLTALFPEEPAIEAAYQGALAVIPPGEHKSDGIAIGQAAAQAVLAARADDGAAAANRPYTEPPGPGVWEPTPPAFLPAFLPGWGKVETFSLRHGAQFRPGPPWELLLRGEEYAAQYDEVSDVGSFTSTTRTAEQSDIARFWYEGSQVGWNRIARILAAQRTFDLWENARLFALVNFALADAYIAGFDGKYFYHYWRPITAIRKGDTDGNSSTAGNPAWSSFLVTPPSPDYPSTHSVLGAAAAEVLRRYLRTDSMSFSMTSGAPFAGITRSFNGLSEAALENANSRVLAGIHFRTATVDGLRMGEKIGGYVFIHALRPVKREPRKWWD